MSKDAGYFHFEWGPQTISKDVGKQERKWILFQDHKILSMKEYIREYESKKSALRVHERIRE